MSIREPGERACCACHRLQSCNTEQERTSVYGLRIVRERLSFPRSGPCCTAFPSDAFRNRSFGARKSSPVEALTGLGDASVGEDLDALMSHIAYTNAHPMSSRGVQRLPAIRIRKSFLTTWAASSHRLRACPLPAILSLSKDIFRYPGKEGFPHASVSSCGQGAPVRE